MVGDPYVEGLRNVYRNAKMLSKSLKRLSTFIKKIIERMVQEETLESLTENILEYCEGSFIREYAGSRSSRISISTVRSSV